VDELDSAQLVNGSVAVHHDQNATLQCAQFTASLSNDCAPLIGFDIDHAKIHPWLSIVLPALVEGGILIILPVCNKHHRRLAQFRVSSRTPWRNDEAGQET
jgi:hypothetical protein